MSGKNTLHIKELDLDTILPSLNGFMNKDHYGSKIVVIGAPGTGKSNIIASIIHAKRHIFPAGIFISGTEEEKPFYSKFVPNVFIHHAYDEELIERFIQRQKYAIKYLKNPWCVCLLDDVTEDSTIFNSKTQQAMYKNGRHWKMLYILALQYALDMNHKIRPLIDGVFILRDPNIKTRRKIWENYAGIIPDFKVFCELMDGLTEDHTSLFIRNRSDSNKIEDCVFYYKAPHPPVPQNFRFGSSDYIQFHNDRYDPEAHLK